MGDKEPFMRVASRAYLDDHTKPHIRHDMLEGTFKANISDEADIEEAVDSYREWLYDSFDIWQELQEEG